MPVPRLAAIVSLIMLPLAACARPAPRPAPPQGPLVPKDDPNFDPRVEQPAKDKRPKLRVERLRRHEVPLSGGDGVFGAQFFERGPDYSTFWPSEPRFDPDIRLPPAWAFGLIFGCYKTQAMATESVDA